MPHAERVLITGGAGFVGSHLADALAQSGYRVTIFDSLEPQVHGVLEDGRPAYLAPDLHLVRGDVRDMDALAPLVREADFVFHLAAAVGVGQSMYEVRRYTDINTVGVATLLQVLVEDRGAVRKLVVASSMSIYGEGAYRCAEHGPVAPRLRTAEQLAAHDWEVHCPTCEQTTQPLPTGEEKPLFPTSIYAITKRDHEEMVLAVAQAYGLPSVALRFFNIYGSRQALSNPYTGAAAIFSGRILAGRTPLLFEDGNQLRDFVHVSDIVQACTLAMTRPEADYGVFNVGSGRAVSVRQVAEVLARELNWQEPMEVTEKFRAGDIRHCYADITRIQQTLGYEPKVLFEDGVAELVRWVAQQQGSVLPGPDATGELLARGLVR